MKYSRYGEVYEKWETGKGVYVVVDPEGLPRYVGKTGGKDGFADRYNGATFIDAMSEGSGRCIFFAEVPAELCNAVEAELIHRAHLVSGKKLFNKSKLNSPQPNLLVQHRGEEIPRFEV